MDWDPNSLGLLNGKGHPLVWTEKENCGVNKWILEREAAAWWLPGGAERGACVGWGVGTDSPRSPLTCSLQTDLMGKMLL